MRRFAIAFLPASILLLQGCAMGPEFKTPDVPTVKQYTELKLDESTLQLVSANDMSEKWWQAYGNRALDHLIEAGLNESPDLKAATARLRSAQADFTAQGGTIRYPRIDGSVNSKRAKVSGASFGQRGGFIYNLHTASLDVAFMLDPFGAGRRYLESLRAGVDHQGFQLEAARVTLTTNIANTAITEASLRSQIRAAGEIVESRREQLAIVQRQLELGVVTEADLLAQRTAVAEAETALPPLAKQLARIRHRLATLIGRFPGQSGLPQFELAAIRLPEKLPLTLPSELVRQRPDIRAAEAQLHRASALVGLAEANLYPSLTLSAGFGRQGVQFADLLTGPASGIWNLGGSILQPLFHGGELTAKRRQALADFDAARAQYQQTVLQAFRDVADVLMALENDQQSLQLQQRAAALSEDSVKLIQRQYQLGATSYTALLNAEEQFTTHHLAVIQARTALLTDSVAMFQAMGGGWWQRSDAYRPVARDASLTHFWESANQPEAHDE